MDNDSMKRFLTVICAAVLSCAALSAQNAADTIKVSRNDSDTLVIVIKEKKSVDRQAEKEQKITEKAMKAPYMVNVGYKTGYRADVELSWSNRAIWGISSSHGFSFGNGLYVGGGAGFSAEMTKNDEKWNASYMVPVFADIKYSFMNTLVTPFVSMKGGAIADITNTGIRTFANPAIGIDVARFSLKAGYEYQFGFWGHLDRVHSHKVKLGVAYTF